MRETKKALIVVRTYPTPAKSGVEVSCTAAISDSGEWLRLFPVPYRFLTPDKRFAKYQWIEVSTIRATNDARPESYKIAPESITILSNSIPTTNAWEERKALLAPLQAPSLCYLQRQRDANGFPTLGFFRPRSIDRFVIDADDANWTPKQLGILEQGNLFEKGPQKKLEKVPFAFRYHFHCDDPEWHGHKLMCADKVCCTLPRKSL